MMTDIQQTSDQCGSLIVGSACKYLSWGTSLLSLSYAAYLKLAHNQHWDMGRYSGRVSVNAG